MALIERFEDIHDWQDARKLVKKIYQLTNSGSLAKDFGLRASCRAQQFLRWQTLQRRT